MPGTRAHPAWPAPGHWPHQDQDPRLYPPRDAHLVCRAQLSGGEADHPHRPAPPPPGVARLPQDHRRPDPARSRHPSDRRQLRHPQARRSQEVAGQASPLPHALHSHLLVLAQLGRTLLSRSYRLITEKSFASVGELSDAIIGFLAEHNKTAKPYLWRAKGEDILRKIEAARRAMATNQATLPC